MACGCASRVARGVCVGCGYRRAQSGCERCSRCQARYDAIPRCACGARLRPIHVTSNNEKIREKTEIELGACGDCLASTYHPSKRYDAKCLDCDEPAHGKALRCAKHQAQRKLEASRRYNAKLKKRKT